MSADFLHPVACQIFELLFQTHQRRSGEISVRIAAKLQCACIRRVPGCHHEQYDWRAGFMVHIE